MPAEAGVNVSRVTPTPPNLAFYEAAATVIPVLFITLLVQLRVHQRLEEHASGIMLVVVAGIVPAASGEITALTVLSSGEPSLGAGLSVTFGLVILGAGVLWEGLRTPLRRLYGMGTWPRRAFWALLGYLALNVLAVTIVVIRSI